MRKSTLFNVLFALVAVATLALLFYKTRAIDFELHQNVVEHLRQLKQIDTAWNEEVLKTRLALNTNYDPVVTPLPVLSELKKQLENDSGLMSGVAAERITSGVKDLIRQLNEKEALIEEFKSKNSILRNSIRYLPVAVSELQGFTANDAIRIGSSLVLETLLEYNVTSDEDKRNEAEVHIDKLKRLTAIQSGELREQLEIVLAHAGKIINDKPVVDEAMTSAVSLSTRDHIDDLQNAYNRNHEQRLNEVQEFRLYLLGLSAIVLLWALYLAARLLGSYRKLDRANLELVNLNQNLETRVEERTQQLSDAYNKLKDVQMQLIQSEKMSALGQLVAGVAHEINTPLGYVRNNLQMFEDIVQKLDTLTDESRDFLTMVASADHSEEKLSRQYQRVHDLTEHLKQKNIVPQTEELLDDSVAGIDRISEIVLSLKDFSRMDQAPIDDFDVNKGLEDTLKIAHNVLKHKAQIIRDYAQGLPPIECSPSQINQVFLNLITNAAQAIDGQGKIRLITRDNGQYVDVIVQDNGRGIEEQHMDKIFDPFFTTKPVGEGTGLGLSICYKIIEEQHNGRIMFKSRPGEGTIAIVRLPKNAQHQRAA